MTFNSDDFLKTNLIEALKNGSFEPEKVNIFAFNYKQNGDITADSFNAITQAVTDYQAELAKEAEAQSESVSDSDSTSNSESTSDSTSESTSETAS